MSKKLRKGSYKTALMLSCIPLSLLFMPSLSALAQEVAVDESSSPVVDEIIATGNIVTRNRTSSTAPELVYDTEFFQKFEPVSAGDMLKRVPGVAFTSDIGEYDAPQMRGMADGFTQILVNGRPLPGAGNDRTVFVDRIPAEIIERIEIIRSPSADIDSQGVGGTINIILKDGANLPSGGSVRAAAIYYSDDKKTRGSGAIGYAGRSANDRMAYYVSMNVQSRYNAKKLVEEVILAKHETGLVDGREAFSPDDITKSKASEYQTELDQRENLDIAFNADVSFDVGDEGSLRVEGFYINTDRTEREDSRAYEVDDDDFPTSAANPLIGDKIESQDTEIDLSNYGIGLVYEDKVSDTLSYDVTLNYSQFNSTEVKTDKEFAFVSKPSDADEKKGKRELETEISKDREASASFSVKKDMGQFSLKTGVTAKIKKRNYSNLEQEAVDDAGALGAGVFSEFFIKETRFDGYIVGEWKISDGVTFETGTRIEHTSTDQEFSNAGATSGTAEASTTLLNPSAHLQADVGENGQFRLSVARTVRRPTFDQLVPALLTDKPEDDDAVVGNPDLKFETSWGLDVGYEYSLPGSGITGINFFYRKVSNLNQLINTGDTVTVSGDEFTLYRYENIGKGKTWGIEFDLSTSLDFVGLDNTGFFANYTRLWSERFDENAQIDVRFNHQPTFVYNIGVTQDVPSMDVTFGTSYQKQGLARSVFLGEIEDQWYDGNLELFLEKRFDNGVTLRFTGNNLLNANSYQAERNFDGDTTAEVQANQRAGNVKDYEIERETASRVFMVTARYSF